MGLSCSGTFQMFICVCVLMFVMCAYVCVHIHIYIYIERERERDQGTSTKGLTHFRLDTVLAHVYALRAGRSDHVR